MIQLGDRMFEVVGIRRMGDNARLYIQGGHFDDIPWKPYGQALWDQLVTTCDTTVQDKVDAAAKGTTAPAVNTTT